MNLKVHHIPIHTNKNQIVNSPEQKLKEVEISDDPYLVKYSPDVLKKKTNIFDIFKTDNSCL